MTRSDAASDTPQSLGEQAYDRLRRMIVRLDFAPGDVLREDDLQERLGMGRTPIREALQRLAREHFVTVIPRRGMFVAGIEVEELSMLFETRTVLEPYAARLAAARGNDEHWAAMQAELDALVVDVSGGSVSGGGSSGGADDGSADDGRVRTSQVPVRGAPAADLLEVDRRCHEIMWEAAGNRFLIDSLDTLYAQSDRLWHLYLADVGSMEHAVNEHAEILALLSAGDGDAVADLVESHVRSFDELIRAAVTARLASPLAADSPQIV